MKTLTKISILLVVFTALVVEADAGSFNFSGSFDPGFTIGIGRPERNRRHRAHVRNEEAAEDAPGQPSPDQIHHFDVPEAFTHDANENGADDGNSEPPARHHGGPHRHRRH